MKRLNKGMGLGGGGNGGDNGGGGTIGWTKDVLV